MSAALGASAAGATVGATVAAAAARLRAAGVEEPRADAEVLVAHALGTTRAALVATARDPFPSGSTPALEALVARRVRREPLHYLLGEREFWSLAIAVDPRVLIPRPETETVVEVARQVAPRARRVLDVGTGSGAIAAALAQELPGARLWASDVDAGALAVARRNLARHAPGVRLLRADLLAPFRGAAFDLVVSNPPYVPDTVLPTLAPEVRDHEPRVALAGGADGLDVLDALVAEAAAVLAPGGWLVVELGCGQAERVRARVGEDGPYRRPMTVRDAAGIERVLAAECVGGGGRRGKPCRRW